MALTPSYVGVLLEKGDMTCRNAAFGCEDVARRIWRCPRRDTKLIIAGRPDTAPDNGEAGTDSDADLWRPSTLCMTAAHATGKAGDVFLCHPFMVHTATWPHRGARPRMIAQPAVNAPSASRWTAPMTVFILMSRIPFRAAHYPGIQDPKDPLEPVRLRLAS